MVCGLFLNSSVTTMRTIVGSRPVFASGNTGYGLYFALARLRGIGPEKFIFQGSPIEASNDRLHLISGGRFDESESFRFLRLVIADYFYGICDQVVGGQPLFNIVRGDPDRQIT